MCFADKWAAIVWMCKKQLGQRNCTEEQRAYIIKEEYEAQKMTQGTNNQYVQAKSEKDPTGHFQSSGNATRDAVAESHNVSPHYVQNAVEFGRGLDVAEQVSPGFKDAVLTGAVKATKSSIASISKMTEPEQRNAVEVIEKRAHPRPAPNDGRQAGTLSHETVTTGLPLCIDQAANSQERSGHALGHTTYAWYQSDHQPIKASI